MMHKDCNGREIQLGDKVMTNDMLEGVITKLNEPDYPGEKAWHEVTYPKGSRLVKGIYDASRLRFVAR